MREIKFRGWDKELNFMINIKRYKIDFDGQVLFDNNDKELYNQTNKIELMQYTGLKDKNDVEIYEFDIVKGNYLKGIGVVGWNDKFCKFDISHRMNITPSDEFEIIGNIYEHSHLLDNN